MACQNNYARVPRNGQISARAGVGLKPEHYRTILETAPDIGFFEVHAAKTTWALAAPAPLPHRGSASAIHCRCMGWACRSAPTDRSIAAI